MPVIVISSEANRWREPGDITNVPAMSEVYTSYSSYMYDILLEKGNYLRCSYMTLGYNLKPEWLHKIGFSTARLQFLQRKTCLRFPVIAESIRH